MNMAKRVGLFVGVNLLIVLTITTVTSLLGIQPYLSSRGINLQALAAFCLLWGFGGAFISLAISRVTAKWMMGVKLIDPGTRDSTERWLIERVHMLAKGAKLPAMPQVGIYDSDEVNAFATGPTKSRALVAVSTGLLRRMNSNEAEGVLGHEVAHIANGDMVTMTLVQGVVNAFVMFFARVIAWSVSQFVDEERRHWVHFAAVFLFEIVFSILGMFVVAAFSRAREYRADAGGATLAGRANMIAGLQKLKRTLELTDDSQPSLATMKISSGKSGGLMAWLSTHPDLDDRIRRLEMA
ncbi:MAG TPA: protease HtpX [Candidatus Binatia bacterium]|nr:protease HtpX [Candidatus Binatia bacterium]